MSIRQEQRRVFRPGETGRHHDGKVMKLNPLPAFHNSRTPARYDDSEEPGYGCRGRAAGGSAVVKLSDRVDVVQDPHLGKRARKRQNRMTREQEERLARERHAKEAAVRRVAEELAARRAAEKELAERKATTMAAGKAQKRRGEELDRAMESNKKQKPTKPKDNTPEPALRLIKMLENSNRRNHDAAVQAERAQAQVEQERRRVQNSKQQAANVFAGSNETGQAELLQPGPNQQRQRRIELFPDRLSNERVDGLPNRAALSRRYSPEHRRIDEPRYGRRRSRSPAGDRDRREPYRMRSPSFQSTSSTGHDRQVSHENPRSRQKYGPSLQCQDLRYDDARRGRSRSPQRRGYGPRSAQNDPPLTNSIPHMKPEITEVININNQRVSVTLKRKNESSEPTSNTPSTASLAHNNHLSRQSQPPPKRPRHSIGASSGPSKGRYRGDYRGATSDTLPTPPLFDPPTGIARDKGPRPPVATLAGSVKYNSSRVGPAPKAPITTSGRDTQPPTGSPEQESLEVQGVSTIEEAVEVKAGDSETQLVPPLQKDKLPIKVLDNVVKIPDSQRDCQSVAAPTSIPNDASLPAPQVPASQNATNPHVPVPSGSAIESPQISASHESNQIIAALEVEVSNNPPLQPLRGHTSQTVAEANVPVSNDSSAPLLGSPAGQRSSQGDAAISVEDSNDSSVQPPQSPICQDDNQNATDTKVLHMMVSSNSVPEALVSKRSTEVVAVVTSDLSLPPHGSIGTESLSDQHSFSAAEGRPAKSTSSERLKILLEKLGDLRQEVLKRAAEQNEDEPDTEVESLSDVIARTTALLSQAPITPPTPAPNVRPDARPTRRIDFDPLVLTHDEIPRIDGRIAALTAEFEEEQVLNAQLIMEARGEENEALVSELQDEIEEEKMRYEDQLWELRKWKWNYRFEDVRMGRPRWRLS